MNIEIYKLYLFFKHAHNANMFKFNWSLLLFAILCWTGIWNEKLKKLSTTEYFLL